MSSHTLAKAILGAGRGGQSMDAFTGTVMSVNPPNASIMLQGSDTPIIAPVSGAFAAEAAAVAAEGGSMIGRPAVVLTIDAQPVILTTIGATVTTPTAPGPAPTEGAVPSYANTTVRDATYGSAPVDNPLCWIVNRGGHCYWDPGSSRWRWLSVHNKVSGGIRTTGADSNSITGGVIIAQSAVTLPPGNRLLHITASGVVTNLSGSATAAGRLYVFTPTGANGLQDGENWMQAALGTAQDATVSRSWYHVANGSVRYELWGLQAQGTGGVRFTSSWIQVFDHGPTDD